MGAHTSKERLGDRVKAARKRLESDKRMQEKHEKQIKSVSTETLSVLVQSIVDSFEACSPFSEATLLVAFKANPEEIQRAMIKSCKKVLSAPIAREEYQWFKHYVLPSSVWMSKFLYEDLMMVTRSMSNKIYKNMDSILKHLQLHERWDEVSQGRTMHVLAC